MSSISRSTGSARATRLAPALRPCAAEVGSPASRARRVGQRVDVAGLDEEAVLAVADDVGHAADRASRRPGGRRRAPRSRSPACPRSPTAGRARRRPRRTARRRPGSRGRGSRGRCRARARAARPCRGRARRRPCRGTASTPRSRRPRERREHDVRPLDRGHAADPADDEAVRRDAEHAPASRPASRRRAPTRSSSSIPSRTTRELLRRRDAERDEVVAHLAG